MRLVEVMDMRHEVTRKNMTFDDNDRDPPNRADGTPYSAGRGIA